MTKMIWTKALKNVTKWKITRNRTKTAPREGREKNDYIHKNQSKQNKTKINKWIFNVSNRARETHRETVQRCCCWIFFFIFQSVLFFNRFVLLFKRWKCRFAMLNISISDECLIIRLYGMILNLIFTVMKQKKINHTKIWSDDEESNCVRFF